MRNRSSRLSMTALFWVLLPVLAARGQTPPNLLTNPGFEGGGTAGMPQAWEPFWSRIPNAGGMSLDTVIRHGGQASLKVVHTGDLDWSVTQSALTLVTPGDIVRISAFVKCENTDSVQISLVTRRADGAVLDWSAGAAETSGTQGWLRLLRDVVVPPACATIQFRMIGTGKATAWLDDANLIKTGTVSVLQSKLRLSGLRNRFLAVSISSGGLLIVKDLRDGRVWRQQPVNADMVVTAAKRAGPSALRLSVWDVPDDLTLQVILTIAADAPELTAALSGDGALGGYGRVSAAVRDRKRHVARRAAQRRHHLSGG